MVNFPDKPQKLNIPATSEVYARASTMVVEPQSLWTRPAAEFVVDLSGGSLAHSLLAEQRNDRHSVHYSTFSKRTVFGHHHLHAFVGEDMEFDCQDIENYRRRLEYHIQHHPGRDLPMPQIAGSGDSFVIDFSNAERAEATYLPGHTLFGTPIEPLNWGMWLLQGLPIAARFKQERTAEKLLVFNERPWQRTLLATMGVADNEIVRHELGKTYICETLSAIQYSHIELVPTPDDCGIYERLVRSLAPKTDALPFRRVFLSRKSVTAAAPHYRALVNEDAVISEMERMGFEVHEPEKLSFVDQIRLFREARVVVGLGGAALFNVVFCQPGTTVVSIESSTHFVHGHANLFASLGHRFGFVLGKQDETDAAPVHKRWSIDPAALTDVIKGIN